jgi:hypothetical protein
VPVCSTVPCPANLSTISGAASEGAANNKTSANEINIKEIFFINETLPFKIFATHKYMA